MRARLTTVLPTSTISHDMIDVPSFDYLEDVLLQVATHPHRIIDQAFGQAIAKTEGRTVRAGSGCSQPQFSLHGGSVNLKPAFETLCVDRLRKHRTHLWRDGSGQKPGAKPCARSRRGRGSAVGAGDRMPSLTSCGWNS
jgi:hypothetical protein